MFEVDTLFVISSARGDYPLYDLLQSIDWSATGGSHFTVIVDEAAKLTQTESKNRYQVLRSNLPPNTPSGFHRAAGLKWAIEQGFAYRQIVLLSDTCLLLTQGIDTFFLEHLQKDKFAAIGVRDRIPVLDEWRTNQTLMFEWGLPVADFDNIPISLNDDVLFLTGQFAAELYRRDLLTPKSCHRWFGHFGTYTSWVAHMLGYSVISWGYNDKPLPPLYVNPCQGGYLPAPHLLSKQFLVFSPVNAVMAYSEGDLRELFKQHRGDDARQVLPFGPIVSGPAGN